LRRPVDVRVYELKPRPSSRQDLKKPLVRWQVRWKVDRQERAKTLETKALAEDFRRRLKVASDDGLPFDLDTGLPKAWATSKETFFSHSEAWLASKRRSWSIRSDRSAVEAMTRAVMLTLRPKAPPPPPDMHAQLRRILAGERGSDAVLRWIRRWSLPLDRLTVKRAGQLHDDLGIGLRGGSLSPHTANRMRTVVHAAITAAVEANLLAEDPWPKRGRRTRKNSPVLTPVDPTILPSLDDVQQVMDAMPKRNLKDRRAVLATAFGLYAGLRPSEILVLRPSDITLPNPQDTGAWGTIRVTRSEDGAGGADRTKTGRSRTVPMHAKLVAIVREHQPYWKGELRHCGDGPPLTIAGWRYRMHAGCSGADVDRFSAYDLRHVCATLMLQSGMNHALVAKRLGNSVPVLEAYYSGVMRGDEEMSNALMAAAFG
jgi:integrase